MVAERRVGRLEISFMLLAIYQCSTDQKEWKKEGDKKTPHTTKTTAASGYKHDLPSSNFVMYELIYINTLHTIYA